MSLTVREKKALVQQLIRKTKGTDHNDALSAIEELQAEGVIVNGSLKGANFELANLDEASFSKVLLHSRKVTWTKRFHKLVRYFADFF